MVGKVATQLMHQTFGSNVGVSNFAVGYTVDVTC